MPAPRRCSSTRTSRSARRGANDTLDTAQPVARLRHRARPEPPACGSSARSRPSRSPPSAVAAERRRTTARSRWPRDTGIGTEPRRHHHVGRRSATARTAAPATEHGRLRLLRRRRRSPAQVLTVDIDTPTGPPRHGRRASTTPTARWSPSTTTLAPAASTACVASRVPTAGAYYVARRRVRHAARPTRSTPASGDRRRAPRAPTTSRSRPASATSTCYAVQPAQGRRARRLGRRRRARGSASTTPPGDARDRLGPGRHRASTRRSSPLPGGGNAVADHVADEDRLALRRRVAAATAPYDITVEAYRPRLDTDPAGADALPRLRRRPGQHRRSSAARASATLSPLRGVPRPAGA